MPVGRRQTTDVDSEVPRNREAYQLAVEVLALDLAGIQHIFRQRLQNRFRLELEAERLHLNDEEPLSVTHIGQELGQALLFPAKPGPVLEVVDMRFYSPHHVRRI